MTDSHISVFDSTLHKTHHWLEEIMIDMGWQDQQKAYVGLRATLHALRDRLPPKNAINLSAQLPMLVRGFYFEGWHLEDKPLNYRHKDEFLQLVSKEAPSVEEDEIERVVTAVFHRLSIELSPGEADKVRKMLPEELRELWPISGL